MAAAEWVLATRNAGKLRELRSLFATAGVGGTAVRVIDLDEARIPRSEPEESGIESFETFEENALAKARYFFRLSGGRPVVADDSGLELSALDGAPGVRSKRWSGRVGLEPAALDAANNAVLRERLAGVVDRRARFVCAAAWCGPAGAFVARGELAGVIVDEPSGGHGFGYDPHFYCPALGRTLAEATVAEKQSVSHRGRAFAALVGALRGAGLRQVGGA